MFRLFWAAPLALTWNAVAAPLNLVGKTGDGAVCRVSYAPDWRFSIAAVRVEGHYTENDAGLVGRFNEKIVGKAKKYSSVALTEDLAGPLPMAESATKLASGGRLGGWIGTTASAFRDKQQETKQLTIVGATLAEPRRVIFDYSVRRVNKFHFEETVYTRTIDCKELQAVPPGREI